MFHKVHDKDNTEQCQKERYHDHFLIAHDSDQKDSLSDPFDTRSIIQTVTKCECNQYLLVFHVCLV